VGDEIPGPQPPTLTQRWAFKLLALFGWRVDFIWPPAPKCVILVYPHTSNWDFVVGIIARYAIALPLLWLGKDTLFRRPFGSLFRRCGGVPINRREHTGVIGQLVAEFERRSWFWLVITPEGTRSRTEHWKSGFYHLALAAKVPVGLGFIDYQRRVVGISTYLALTGKQDEDLAAIRAFYADKTGRRPEKTGPIRFREEPRGGADRPAAR